MKRTMHLFTRFSIVAATICCLLLATTGFAQPGFLPVNTGQVYSGASITGALNGTQDSLIITVEVMYDCSISLAFPDTLLLVSLGCVPGTIPIPNVSDGEITDICAGSLPSCAGGSSDGERMIVYRGAVDITTYAACSPATFIVYPYNRMDAINLANSASASSDRLRVFMQYNFTTDSLNTTPSFAANGHPFLCGGTTVNWGPQVTEPDGDSLVFSLRQPQTGIATASNIAYQTGYSLADPFGNGMSFDSETGIMSFTPPDTTDLFQIVIQVDEYDRTSGNLISTVIRDFQFETDSNCSNLQPTVATSITNVTGGSLTSNYVVTLDTGVASSFDLAFTGGAGETVSISSTATGMLNGASTSTATSGTTTTMTVSWTPTGADVGTHIITFNAEDNGCDIAGKNAQKVYVIVQEQTQPLQITSVTAGQETCPDSNDGTLTINVTGGTGPFSFTVDGFNTGNSVTQTTGSFVDLAPDFYIVQVGDSGVSWDTTFSVTVQPSFFGFLGTPFNQLVDPSCDDACDGDARSRPNPFGNSPYTYLWSNGETTVKAFNLCGGSHTVSITDNIGCTITDTVTLFEPPSIYVLLDSSDSVTCNGGNDGAAFISGHGGTIASDSTTAYLIDQTEGEFEPYGIGESFNTANYQSFSLGDDALTAAISVGFNFEFFGNAQTTFQISSNGIIQFPGATNSTWQNVAIPNTANPDNWIGIWDDLNPSTSTNGTIETYLVGTSPNRVRVINYVNIRHFASAGALYTFQIALYETSNIIQIHTTQVPAFSEGGGNAGTTMGIENADGTDGYAVPGRNAVNWSASNDYVSFIPITQGFTYTWSSIGSGSSATNLSAGVYTVTAADGACNDTLSFTIEEPVLMTLDTTMTPPTCPGDSNGAITVSANGGNGGPYTYIWSTGSTSTTISNLMAGTYTVTVTDVKGCAEAIAVTLNDPAPVVVSINVDANVSCFGFSDGQLTATGSGGTPGFTYLWNTASTNQTISGLAAGMYTVTVTDASGCTGVDSAEVTEPTVLAISIASISNVSCVGGSDGSITANNATGGTGPYAFLWSSGGNALTESGLAAGTYTITVTDDNGCTATADTVLTEPATGVSISIASAIDVSCNGGSDGSVTANSASGGTAPYTLLWSSGGNGLTETGLTAGTYSITVTDAGGCVDSADTTIVEPALLVVDTTIVSQPTCAGSANGSITVTTTGGSPAYSYAWNNGDTTATVSGLTAGTYTVTVTDANTCTDNITVVLANGPSITASIAIDNLIDCNGNNSGQLTASGSNGTPVYTFLWSNLATSGTISSLVAGTYTVTVTDANGCEDSTSAVLVDPALLTAAITDSTDVGCQGGNDGDATAQGTGGTAPLAYLWNNGDTTTFISGLVAGTYTVTVTDANNCTASASVTINQPSTGITATVTGTDVTCFGLSNGTASASGSGGTAPYSYLWNTAATSPNLTGLGAGTYTATVTDDNGCTGVDSVTITAPAFPVIAVTSTDSVSCFGANDGQIQAFLINGTAPLTYAWSTLDTTQLVTSLAAGTYTVTVTDANGCSDTQTDIIAGPVALDLTMDSISPSCSGNSDGSAWVSVTGGTGTYTYLWNTAATADSISSLAAGTYIVTVTDGNGCEGIDSVVLINGTGVQAILTLVNHPSCAGTTTGSLAANASNASAPFNVSYLWNTAATSNLLFSVGAGTYTVTVTDNNTGCEDDTTITLIDPPALVASIIDSLNPTCGNTDGEAEALGTGGTGALSYVWTTGDTTALITGLGGGSFTVTVTDGNGCEDSASVTLIAPVSFTATGAELASETCVGNDGQVTVTMVGGTAPFSFNWSNGDTTQTVTGLAANTYTVTVTDASGCSDTSMAIVADSCTCNWTATAVLINDLFCNGDSSGQATVNHAGAAAPVSYLWSNGSTNDSLIGVPAGTYTVTVTDIDGCVDTSEVDIDEPVLLQITGFSSISQPTCDDDCNGSATVNAAGGSGTLTYVWSSGGSSSAVTALCGGGHFVTVSDANGCEAIDLIALVERPALFAQVDSTDSVSCPGNNDGSAFLSAHGGFAASDSTTEYIIDQTEGSFEPYPTGRPWNALNYKTFPLNDDATSDTINIFGGDDFEFFGVSHTHFIMNSQGFITFDLSNPNSGQVNGQFSNSTAIPSPAANTPRDFIAAFWEDLDPSVGTCQLETYLIGTAPNRVRVVNYIEIDHFSGTTGSGDISTFQIVLYETSNIIQIHSDSLNSDGGTHVQGIENFAGTKAFATPGRNNTNFSTASDYVAFIPVTQNFTYTWSSIGSGSSDTTLLAGNYTVTASDGTCEDTVQFEIFEPANGLNVGLSSTTSFCFVCSGTATANVSNGTAPYTYAWSNTTTNNTPSTLDTITSLCSGPYSVTVTDADGCVDSNSVVVNDLFAPAVTASAIDVSCANACDGVVIATFNCFSCGPAEWFNFPDTTTVIGTGDTLTGRCPGTYLVRITTGFGCSRFDTIDVVEPTPLILVMDSTDAACSGSPTGGASVTVSGGTTTYTYLWNTGGTNDTIDNKVAGTYTVTVTDANGCMDTAEVTINQGTDLIASATLINDVTCNGGTDGSAVATQTGGSGPFTYLWSDASTNDTLFNASAGNYIVTITGSNGCFDTASIQIDEPDTIGFAFTETPISCGGSGNDGAISLTASGGTPGYTYLWSTSATGTSISGLVAGTYCVTVTDAAGCVDSACYILNPPGTFSVAIADSSDVLCFGDANGYAVVQVIAGGSGNYGYLWDNAATTDTVNNLATGLHSVTVTDLTSGCIDSATVFIDTPTLLVISIDSVDSVSCLGGSNGVVCVTASGGTPTYTYSWSNGTTTPCANSLAAGTHTVTVTDMNGCVAIGDTVVSEPATGVTASVSITAQALCNGDSATLQVTGSGGSGSYTFLWPGGLTTPTVQLPAGNYCVTVNDGGACEDTACITVIDPSPVVASVTQSLPSCPGGNDGSLTANGSGGTPGYTYLWSTGSTNQTIIGLSSGTYGLKVTDANGCSDSAGFFLADPTGMGVVFSNINTSSCGSCNGSATANITGGATPYNFNWLTGGSTGATGTSLCAGQNEVVVTDASGCIDTFTVNVPTLGADTVQAAVIQEALCNGGSEGSASASYVCSVAPCTVAWFDVASSTLQGTTDTITGLSAGDYYVQLTNDSGCVSFDTITISEPSPVVATITASTAVNCLGGSDGTASVSGSGGTPGYTYEWPSGNTGPNETGLSAGSHCVTVTDANGCEDTACVIIGAPTSGISVSGVLIANVICNGGNDGSVTAIASGGTAPYTLTWNGTIVADTLFNLTAGSYIVVASDNGSCTATDTVVVTEPDAITASFSNVQNPSCPGDTNGQATVNVSGGTPGYSYLWPNGSTDSVATGLSDGTYCVTITDAAGCQDTFCIGINDPSGMTNSFSGITTSSCTVCDGNATANPVGGNGTAYTYLWDNGQTGASNDSLCAGINSVTITDTSGCELIATVPINADSADSVVAVGIDPTCGNCDGMVFATYTCTVAPCTVEWTDLSTFTVIGTTDTINNLCAGSYSVELTNGAGCVSTSIVTIDAPDLLDPNETITDVSCFGACDGSIVLATTGGSGTYTYTWSNGATSATNAGLCAGSYTVTISDGSGCDSIATFDVGTPTEIISNPTITDATCGNLCDGQINVSPTGGAGGYAFNWSPVPSNGNGTSLADSLCGGFYFLTITDANGCTKLDTFTVFQPQPIVQDTVTVTDATCGDCDGEVDPTFSGGAGGFVFAWSDGQNTLIADSLCFGFYDVTVTDADGCSEVFGYPVSETGGPGVNITFTNATANGLCDGTATANITSSLGTVTYVWSNGDTVQTADTLCAGTYVVTVTDTNGCSTVDTVTISEPDVMSIDFTITEISCAGNGCDGEILAAVSGGVQPYSYAWSNGDTTALITGLCSGTYTLTVTDSNGQVLVDSVILGDPTPFTVTANVAMVTCAGDCDGSIDLTITGGSGPISIVWNTGDTTAAISNLCPGTYSVVISDTSGCSDSLDFNINEPAPLAITVDSLTNPDCQVSNGMIAVTASGGTGSTYAYLWLDINGAPLIPTQATQMATNLGAGIYNVEIVDSNGCTDTFNVILNNANAPVITLVDLQHVSCFGECDGSIDVSLSGGTTPYNILWNTGDTATSIDSLCAGSDTITVIDADMCLAFDIYSIEEPDQLIVQSVQVVDVTCGADCDGSISIDSISGGTAPYTLSWSTGATTDSIVDLCAGNYGLTITDANGCTLATSFDVDGPAPMILTLDSIGDATCTNTGDGFISVSMAGGTAPYTYEWIFDGTDTVLTQDIQGALAGSYVLNVYDVNGCMISDTFEVEAEFFVEVTAQEDIEVCPFSTGVKLTGTQSGAASTRWLFTNGVVAGNGINLTVNTTTDTSTYIFEGINGVCVHRDTVRVIWTSGPGIDAGPDKFIEPGESTTIGGAPTANAGVDVLWTPAQDISGVEDENPTVNPLETIVYYVSATDADGCYGLDSVKVTVEEVVDPVGGFSPNGDGVNDFFIIDRIENYPNASVQIFNRWGNLIFESPSGYTTPWNGTYKGKSLPVGTYYYVIDLNDPVISRLITGPVTILK
ncbi:MAG: gliding motility-associated C-terminal domain-containing protein [Cryomorphaceae bacterium]